MFTGHVAFVTKVEQENPSDGTLMTSYLVVVDLAGSENVKKNENGTRNKQESTPKTRKRQTKEAGNILKSLTRTH